MIAVLIRRTLAALPVLWLAATLVFLLAQLVPGDPFSDLSGPGVSAEARDHLRVIFGQDRPLPARYLDWLGGAATGDLGISLSHGRPVTALLGSALGQTVLLAAVALLLQFAGGTGVALWACGRPGGATDRFLTTLSGVASSLPSFYVGVLLVSVFSVGLGWFPPSQMHSVDAAQLPAWGRWLDTGRHLVLPALALAVPSMGAVALYMRDELAEILRRPHLRSAAARGLAPRRLLMRHALRNVAAPLATLFGLALPGLVGGSVVIEVLFAWPGAGRLAYEAVLARDEPLVLGCTLAGAAAVIAGHLLADLLAATADPRVEEQG